ncbi:MFS transporter [Xanthovirga aplysinae]|uniref:MFS transporter n=1 Tax=Xanthovirga aplysinae TaxID=2529853 RepID=UPI0012BB6967|nr:MFS transporter [Xanthovirga aplysinae]MTI32180.1 MFS transporter [Xanthovirga aplysinae]
MKKNAVKLTLLLASSLTVMSGATIAPSLPQMASVFANTEGAEFLSKLILTLPALFIALTAPFVGRFIDRHGRVKLLTIGLLLYALGGTSAFILNDLYHILIGRALLGISVGIIMTIATTLIGDYFEGDERQKFMGIQSAFVAFGGVLFVGAGGLLADFHWRNPFLIYLFSLLVFPLALSFLKEPKSITSPGAEASKKTGKPSKLVFIVFAITFVQMIIFYMVPVQIPFLLKTLGVGKNALSGIAIAANTVGATIFSLLYSNIKKKLSFPMIVSLALLLMTGGYVMVWLGDNYTVIILAMLFSGFGLGLTMPNISLWLIQLSPAEIRGKQMGYLTTSLFLGQFLSPVLVQPLAKQFNLAQIFGLAAVVMIVLSFLFVGLHLKTQGVSSFNARVKPKIE